MSGTVNKAESLILQTLKDSELRYRRLFEAAQDGILLLDAKTGMIKDVNPYLIKMLGCSRDELIVKKLWEVGAFKDITARKYFFAALQENEYNRYEDLPLKTKDGGLIQVDPMQYPQHHRANAGQRAFPGIASAVFSDITLSRCDKK